MGKKSKLVTTADLCNSQCHDSTMMNTVKGSFSNAVWDIVQVNHWHYAPDVDKFCHILYN